MGVAYMTIFSPRGRSRSVDPLGTACRNFVLGQSVADERFTPGGKPCQGVRVGVYKVENGEVGRGSISGGAGSLAEARRFRGNIHHCVPNCAAESI
jgi:hypothetical protein